MKEVELLRCQRHRPAVRVHGPSSRIDQEATESQRIARGSLGLFRRGSAKDRANSRYQFPRAERLHDAVVGAELKPYDPVRLFPACGQHDDGYLPGPAQLTTDLQSVHAWQHEIKDHQIRIPSSGDGESLLTVGRHRDVKAVTKEIAFARGCITSDRTDATRRACTGED